jgi:5-methylcytosine-specific restriction endonuclease McrA
MPAAKNPNRSGSKRVLDDATCKTCGLSFRPRTKAQRFCGRTCKRLPAVAVANKRRRKPRTDCVVCGKEALRAHRRYCSLACYWKEKKGITKSEETRRNMSKSQKNVWDRKGRILGVRASLNRIRNTPAWIRFRFGMLARDAYSCRNCGTSEAELELHHVRPASRYPSLYMEPDNVITLCKPCHIQTPTYAGKLNQIERK